MEQFRENRF